jgi:hypothetical protein
MVEPEFSAKRDDAVSTNERLQQDAQAVLDVIDNPDVIAALRQDKNQNLAYLKENHNVCLYTFVVHYTSLTQTITALIRTLQCSLQLRPVPVRLRKLLDRCGLPLPFPRPLYRQRPPHVVTLGKACLRYPSWRMVDCTRGTQHPPGRYRLSCHPSHRTTHRSRRRRPFCHARSPPSASLP